MVGVQSWLRGARIAPVTPVMHMVLRPTNGRGRALRLKARSKVSRPVNWRHGVRRISKWFASRCHGVRKLLVASRSDTTQRRTGEFKDSLVQCVGVRCSPVRPKQHVPTTLARCRKLLVGIDKSSLWMHIRAHSPGTAACIKTKHAHTAGWEGGNAVPPDP